ncbi:HK97-gp10 family putative phage morphogenesis protein [Atopobacter phocae]|uniref:HK97-gp10 family putative phage morphogenesis protein n=1 Tax=Atopobacter phocae TaxID=136492 RepID=UPI00046ECCA0|nr:HK97-gp10 family putative phage morphogenesis protein [Atopobacter phocae]
MKVEVTGVDEVLANLEKKLGKNRVSRIENKALRDTGDKMVELTRKHVAYYQDTGATYDEVVRSNVRGAKKGIKRIDVGWEGSKSRWRLVHLNEFGYTRFGKRQNPRGMGAVQRAADESKSTAIKEMHEGLKELVE